MQEKVLNNGYEDDKIIITYGKNKNGSIFYMCMDKETKDTMPLGACIWCGKDVP
jgi:ribosomal protein L24E